MGTVAEYLIEREKVTK
ncbi:hypothetical protein TIFTF001_052070 [Ficus carica]|uniref:Uncharacterized protein n=1 Tax=Ficus carica TaxID=3494 RepID=A0AA88JDI7_FICCA|nr:hypothetical protein TIFTF001_052070 [Ficus carica]